MAIFIFGLILFLSVHSIGIFADQWRAIQIKKFGNRKYKFLYSFLSLAGLVLMTIGYKQHTYIADIAIWSAPSWAWSFVVYSNLIPLILLVAAYIPHNAIKIKLKDPMTIGVIIWAATHLVYVTSLAGIILFLSFLIWGALELMTCRKNHATMRSKNEKVSIPMTFLTVVLGIAFWSLFARYAYYLLVSGNTQSFFQYWFECIRSTLSIV
jgi:uncharacterized membrane protein